MKPVFAIIAERVVSGLKVIEVDTTKAKYQGVSWRTMGDYGKRKFENLLVLEQKERTHIIYV
jgi:hypothetical protein